MKILRLSLSPACHYGFPRSLLLLGLWVLVGSTANARAWTDATGSYKVEADAIAFNDEMVILKKESGDLVAIELAELSDDDQRYIKSDDFGDTIKKSVDQMQTWTSPDGLKIRGRVLEYGQNDLGISRVRGKVVVNGEPFDQIDPLHQRLVLKILSKLEGRPIRDAAELTTWAKGLGGETKTYPLEGVLMELESGDRIAVPFFLFDSQDRKFLEPGWQSWLAAKQDVESQKRESFMMQSEAMAYQQEKAERRQIEYLKLNLLAARTGLTSIWEVGLVPGPGVYGRNTTTVVTARDSEIASQIALQQYPSYRIGFVRRLNNRY